MAVARQNDVQKLLGEFKKVQQRLDKLEKQAEARQKNRLTAKIASEYKAATAGTLPIILTIIAVVGGLNYHLSERITDLGERISERMTETTMQLNKRFDDTNHLIRMVKSDLEKDFEGLEKDIGDINEKLDRLLLK